MKRRARGSVAVLLGLVMFLTIFSVAVVVFLWTKNIRVDLKRYQTNIINEDLRNPYTGWVHLYNYTVRNPGNGFSQLITEGVDVPAQLAEDNFSTAGILRFDLTAYLGTELDGSAVQYIGEVLKQWNASDKLMIIQFGYDQRTFADYLRGDPDATAVYRHIESLSQCVSLYERRIVSIGPYSDAETTAFISSNFSSELLHEMYTYAISLFSGINLAIYDFSQYDMFTTDDDTISSSIAFVGTINISDVSEELYAQAEYFAANHIVCLNLVGTPPAEGGADVVRDIATRLHASYMVDNGTALITTVRNSPYASEDEFNGITYYDYFQTHLGYRYIISDLGVTFDNWKDDSAQIDIRIRNIGMTNSVKNFEVRAILKSESNGEIYTYPLEGDTRKITSQGTESFTQSVKIKDLKKGKYIVYVSMIDSSTGEIIKLGNYNDYSSDGQEVGEMVIS